MSILRVGLVGYGSVGEKFHAPLISVCSSLQLTAVVERNSNRSQEKYPNVSVYRSLEKLLEADAADIIVIVTPNEFHYSQAKLALEAGKHVVVDKPVTVHAHEAASLHALAKEKGLILSVFQNRRFDGDIRTVQKLLQEGTLGRIVHFESHFDRFRPELVDNWREKEVPGNGITYDLGTHLIDQAVLLFGKPTAVQATILKQRQNAVADDFFDITLHYPGIHCRLTACCMSNVPMMKFLILGEKGSYIKYGLDVQEKALKEERIPEGPNWGMETAEAWGHLHLAHAQLSYPTEKGDYRIFYQNVADAIHGKASLLVKMEEAILVLQIIEASFESHRTGQRIAIS